MVIGGQAVLLYGEPRLTKDIDITLGIGPGQIEPVLQVVKNLRLKILVDDYASFVDRTMVLPVIDEASGIRVDLIFSMSDYERRAIERSKRVLLDKKPVMFASVEDVIIHKIFAKRPRDLEDVMNIMIKNTVHDRDYIVHWLKRFDEALGGGYIDVFLEIEKDAGKTG